MIFLDFTIENKAKTVFFTRVLGYVIYQWSNANAPHTYFTVILIKKIVLVSWSSMTQSL